MIILKTPTGRLITGTLESLEGVASVSGFSELENGELSPNYVGDTEVDWDSQATIDDAEHGTTYIDEEGYSWFLKDLVREDVCDECRAAPAVTDAPAGAEHVCEACFRKLAVDTAHL